MLSSLHILIVNNTRIPAVEYGGTERIIWWLGKELVRQGHKVTYLVEKGSQCPFGQVLAFDPCSPLTRQIPDNVDLVHLHFQTKENLPKPHLITHHGNFHPDEKYHINTVFVSRNHAERNASRSFVLNGLDPEEYGPVDFESKRKHLLFLAYAKRPEKNLKDCVYITRKTKNVLAVVGGKPKWFKWRPWLDYRGFIGGGAKNKALQESKALLFPVRWHEPFGISMIESMYFGSPVIGTPYGSLPEIVTPQLGFLSDRLERLIDAVRDLGRFDPRQIHQEVLQRYTSERMARDYIKLYEKVIQGQTLNPQQPVNGGNFVRAKLLPIFP